MEWNHTAARQFFNDLAHDQALPKDLIKRYLKAEITDSGLLDEHARSRAQAIREQEDEVYMIADVCYGKDRQRFLDD